MSHAEARGAVQNLVEGTPHQQLFKKGCVSKGFLQGFVKRHHVSNGGQLWSEFPQNMTHLRAEWTTYANLDHYFDMCRDVYLNTNNHIAVSNPAWNKATPEERQAKGIDEILIRRPDCLGSLDEMPFSLNMNTGQKSRSDKKLCGILEGQLMFGQVRPGQTSGLRGLRRGRQRTTKHNKLGTVVAGAKANGEPYPPLLIVKASLMHLEFNFSWVEDSDGQPLRIELPKLRSGGQLREAVVAVTNNGGINVDLFVSYLEKSIFPCHPLMSNDDPVCFHWDGDDSHRLPGTKYREFAERGCIIIPHKPNTTTDMQGQDLVNFPVVQQAIRSAVAARQRLIRRLPNDLRRPLDYRDMVAVLTPALQKGFSRENCLASFAEAGLSPFTRLPLLAPHIMCTKGKSTKFASLNYDKIKYGTACHKSVQALLGKGVRLTVGKICDKPLTHEDNIKLFEGIDADVKLKREGKAAKDRMKKRIAQDGDAEIVRKMEELLHEELKIEVELATGRVQKGASTKADTTFLKSRKVKKYMADLQIQRPQESCQKGRGRGRGRGRGSRRRAPKRRRSGASSNSDSNNSNTSCDSEIEGEELIGKTFVDEGHVCTVTRVTYDSDDDAVAVYLLDGEEEYSSLTEVRAWVAAGDTGE
jgi:hypothetical protein